MEDFCVFVVYSTILCINNVVYQTSQKHFLFSKNHFKDILSGLWGGDLKQRDHL